MEIKGIIFDLDGVIVSTDEYHYRAWKKIADDEGIYFDHEINNRLRGVSRMESLDIILEQASKTYLPEEKLALATKKNSQYVEYLSELNEQHILSGVTDLLSSLKDKNIKLAIGSSSKNANLILEKIGLTKTFDAIADGNGITHSKPDPEVFLLAANLLGLSPENCAVIEDAISGIDAANSAGMLSVLVSHIEEYDKANRCLKSAHEIIPTLEKFL